MARRHAHTVRALMTVALAVMVAVVAAMDAEAGVARLGGGAHRERWLLDGAASTSGSGSLAEPIVIPPVVTTTAPPTIVPPTSTPVVTTASPTTSTPPLPTLTTPPPSTTTPIPPPTPSTPSSLTPTQPSIVTDAPSSPSVPLPSPTPPTGPTPPPRPPGSPSTPDFGADGSPTPVTQSPSPPPPISSSAPASSSSAGSPSLQPQSPPSSTASNSVPITGDSNPPTDSRTSSEPRDYDTDDAAASDSDPQAIDSDSDASTLIGDDANSSGSGSLSDGSDEPVPSSSSSSSSLASVSSSSSSSLASVSSSSSSSSMGLPTLPPSSASSSGSQVTSNATVPTATAATRTTKSPFHDAAVYLCVTCAALSVAMLMVFHVFAFDSPWLNWPHESLSANGWELLLYVGYLQQIASLSHLELLETPAFLSQLTDAFSWSNLLIQRNKVVSPTVVPARRLVDDAVLGGLNAYADRIDIASSDLLVNGVAGFAVVFAFLCLVFMALAIFGKKIPEDKFDIENSVVSAVPPALPLTMRRRGMLWVVGFAVMLWYISLYPLTTLATFQLERGGSNAVLALVVLVVFCVVAPVAFAFAIAPKSSEQLMSINKLKVYGALYADVTHGFRWFFIATALAQIALGVCVGTIKEEGTQLTVALVIVVGYMVAVLLCSPFTSQTPLLFTVGVCGARIINYANAYAFISDKRISVSGRNRAGDAILVITMVVLLLWLARLVYMLATFVRLYADRQHPVETPAYYNRESVKDDNLSVGTNPILGGSGVYVTMMMSPPQDERLGSEFGGSFDTDAAPPRRTARLAQL